MSKEWDDSNTGSLFDNDRKESERHPDYTGSVIVVCPHCGQRSEWWASVWNKIAKSGREWKSLALKYKDAQQNSEQPKRQTSAPQQQHQQSKANGYQPQSSTPALDAWNDDIPF